MGLFRVLRARASRPHNYAATTITTPQRSNGRFLCASSTSLKAHVKYLATCLKPLRPVFRIPFQRRMARRFVKRRTSSGHTHIVTSPPTSRSNKSRKANVEYLLTPAASSCHLHTNNVYSRLTFRIVGCVLCDLVDALPRELHM